MTREKFELAIERLRLDKQAPLGPPVILSHGLLVNSSLLNLNDENSLARYLALQGFDVWNLSFRGTGRSLAPLRDPPRSWSLDALVDQDMPQVIDYVVKESQSSKIGWVGYELGGVLLYDYLGKTRNRAVAALVTIAAPLTFNEQEQSWKNSLLLLDENPSLKKLFLYVNAPVLMKLVVPLVPKIETIFYNPDNVDEEVKERLLEDALASVNPGVLDHLLLMMKRGEAVSFAKGLPYRQSLSNIRIPVLLIGGQKDLLAPPKVLLEVYARLGSSDRTLKLFGSEPKKTAEYGHFDLVVGKDAKKEVFPVIGQWLKRRLEKR